MSRSASPSTGTRYGISRVRRVRRIARSTVYSHRAEPTPSAKRGPKTVISDEQLLAAIRRVLAEAEQPGIRGEGHRKVWARLRHRGISSSRRRILRIMRENDLLAPRRLGRYRGPQVPDGTLITEQHDEMRGTDATCWHCFVAIRHKFSPQTRRHSWPSHEVYGTAVGSTPIPTIP